MKITISSKALDKQPKKYVRLIVTEDASNWHRLVETTDGQLEYRTGAGKRIDMTPRKFRLFVRSIVQAAKSHQIEHLAIHLGTMGCPKLEQMGEEWFWQTLVENLKLAAYEYLDYKSTEGSASLSEIMICGASSAAAKKAIAKGDIIGESTNLTRDLMNMPARDMTPAKLADVAKTIASAGGSNVKATILNESDLKKLKMGALLAVGQGAKKNSPKLIIIEYYGAGKLKKDEKNKKKQPIILAGKGITYDTGGLNVKPSGAMHEMHMDMGGGAAVLGALAAIIDLQLKQNVIAIVPTAENAISEESMRAGDIVTSMSGKTIEVVHTDAEGRMVLADALTYAERYKPKCILDVATLTGASLVALGQHTSAVMTKNDTLAHKLVELGEETGDYMWPLPLWDEYKQHLRSTRADIANINPGFSRFGGAIEGGTFLSAFAPKKVPWAHIDIAPRMTSVPSDKLAKGATGEPVRMLVKFVEEF